MCGVYERFYRRLCREYGILGKGPRFSVPRDIVSQYLLVITDFSLVVQIFKFEPFLKNAVLCSSCKTCMD